MIKDDFGAPIVPHWCVLSVYKSDGALRWLFCRQELEWKRYFFARFNNRSFLPLVAANFVRPVKSDNKQFAFAAIRTKLNSTLFLFPPLLCGAKLVGIKLASLHPASFHKSQ